MVGLTEEDHVGFRLAVELHAHIPGVAHTQIQRLMEEAHRTCPYPKALRGEASVELVVD
jgi:organic hydroperoxide reductase OsmC/OhrA